MATIKIKIHGDTLNRFPKRTKAISERCIMSLNQLDIMRYNIDMNRLEAFESMRFHPWMKKNYLKLKQAELDAAKLFLEINASKNSDEFETELNRWRAPIIDRKKFLIIMELLSCSNSKCR